VQVVNVKFKIMEKFLNYAIEKKELITHQEILSLGWILKDGDFTNKKMVYEKGNYWICFFEQDGNMIFSVLAVDPIKIPWLPHTPENFRIMMKHPTLDAFKTIMAFI
jgi:hypothetical protein